MRENEATSPSLSDPALATLIRTVEDRRLFGPENAALLMVSGGSDSTALARLMASVREAGGIGALAMLHMNHKLRGQDAEDDARFVAELADSLDIPLFLCEVDVAGEAKRSGGNIEAVARRERYLAADEALASMCQHEAFPLADGRIVTAHTLDDRIENFYMRSIVGTGPGGFRSMRYENGDIIRPLLDCTREELRAYLRRKAQSEGVDPDSVELWREDATNEHTDRFRAYVRHEIVPKARQWNPALDTTLGRTMNLIADEDDMVEGMADAVWEEDVETLADGGFLLKPSFGFALRPLQRRVVRKILHEMLGRSERIDAASVEGVLDAFDEEGIPRSGYVTNIQGDIAVSANKKGIRIEPMTVFRARRKRG